MSFSFFLRASLERFWYVSHFAESNGSLASFIPSLLSPQATSGQDKENIMRKNITLRISKILLFTGAVMLLTHGFAGFALAAAADPDILGQISNTFYNEAEGWASTLQDAAYTLFKYFIILDICLFGIRGAFDIKAGNPVGSIMGEFALFVFYAAFMFCCIKYYKEWSHQVIQGFLNLANTAGGSRIEVSDLFRTGLDIAGNIWDSMSARAPLKSLGALVAGLVLLFCFALMAAEVLLVKCEAMIVMNAGIVLLGLGGMRYFKDYSINFMKYGFTVAVKLFVIQLMMSIIVSFTSKFQVDGTKMAELAVIMGASVVMLTLTRNIPSIISSLIMGAHGGGGGGLSGASLMAAAGAIGCAVGSTVVGAINAGRTVHAAGKEASESGATGAGFAAQTAKNVAKAVGKTAWENVTGASSARSSFGQRVASNAASGQHSNKE
jgi:type IV secretion system protein TrbL